MSLNYYQFKNTQKKLLSKNREYPTPIISKVSTLALWFIFIANVSFMAFYFPDIPNWNWEGILRINGFTILIWTTVSFFSAIVSSYSGSYLKGFKYHERFTFLSLGFTVSVMLLVLSDHVLPLLISWLSMGFFMARLIGVNSDWGEAREASKFAQKYFLAGTFFLTVGVLLLSLQSGTFTVSGLAIEINDLPRPITFVAALCIITAAIIQSAMYPFHRWLLSAMTAPTPASALMHAGFVNGAGILLALFSTVLFASNTLTLLFIIGGLTAIIAQFTKLLQFNVKQKLACSTIAQMGFMIMQCGLGFFNAAVAHLILHGFYKAYLFLSAGSSIEQSKPDKPKKIRIKPFQALAVIIYGALGAILFAKLTGKGTEPNSGLFLTLIVAITVGQATYNIVKEQSLSTIQKAIIPPILFLSGIGLYALLYNGATLMMVSMPMIDVPLSVSWLQIAFGIVFLTGFFIMKLGVYRRIPWLYVKLLNVSQPFGKTVLTYKNQS